MSGASRRFAALGDDSERELSPVEALRARQLAGAFEVWERYLAQVWPVGTLDHARQRGAPLARPDGNDRGDQELPGAGPQFLCPAYAARWAVEALTRPPSLTSLADALEFMGAQPASTLRGRDEQDRPSPHRNVEGWWRCSTEIMLRLSTRQVVPVLRGMPGRPCGSGRGVSSVRAATARQALRASPTAVRMLLAEYLRERPPTPLLGTADAQDRPVVTRAPGRPGGVPNVVRSSVLVSPDALARWSQIAPESIGCPPLSGAVMRRALAALEATTPGMATPVRRFSTVDSGGQCYRAWLRVLYGRLGLPDTPAGPLRLEVERWHASKVRGRQAAAFAAERWSG